MDIDLHRVDRPERIMAVVPQGLKGRTRHVDGCGPGFLTQRRFFGRSTAGAMTANGYSSGISHLASLRSVQARQRNFLAQ